MVKHTSHTTNSSATGDHSPLPFARLLQMLQANGFVIDAKDYIEFNAIFDSLNPSSPEELKYYLAPIVCRNQDEQTKFYKLFDDFIIKVTEEPPANEVKTPWWKIALWILLPLTVAGIVYRAVKNIHIGTKEKNIVNGICIDGQNFNTGTAVTFHRLCGFKELKDTSNSSAEWNFGDGTVVKGNNVVHVFDRSGEYKVRLSVTGLNDGSVAVHDTTIYVCPPLLVIRTFPEKTSYRINDTVRFSLSGLDTNSWRSSRHLIISNLDGNFADTLNIEADTLTQPYVIRANGNYQVGFYYNEVCRAGSTSLKVEQKEQYSLITGQGSTPISQTTTANWIYLVLLPLFMIAAVFAFYRLMRPPPKTTPAEKPPTLIPSFEGMKAPFELSFLPKDHHIQSLLDVSKVSYNLSRRTEAALPYLDINTTIRQSIHNLGLVTPAYRNRQRPREYLILIDSSIDDGAQFHLFSYLIKKFARENVNIDLYYYHKKPEKFYKPGGRDSVSVSRLRDCGYDISLIVIGNGNEWLDRETAGLNRAYYSDFEFWEKRVLVTPVPVEDWSVSEKTLSRFFYLVPADMTGWISLAQFITEDATISKFMEDDWKTYSARFVDTDNVDALHKYLGDQDLFQWICALAIHPGIRWEILLEIGNAVLKANKASSKLNYSNLLKISRIKWMRDGAFPASTRLELLKQLDEKNELVARDTMLQLLKESDEAISSDSFAFEEKEIQKYTDSYVLFANDPQKNATYAGDAERFTFLLGKGLLRDEETVTYLKKEGSWKTPVRSLKNQQNIGIEKYIDERDTVPDLPPVPKRSRLTYALLCLSSIVFLLSFAGLIGLMFYKDQLRKWPPAQRLGLVNTQMVESATLYLVLDNETCVRSFLKNADSLRIKLKPRVLGQVYWGVTIPADAFIGLSGSHVYPLSNVPVRDFAADEVGIEIDNGTPASTLYSTVRMQSDSIHLKLTGTDCDSTPVRLFILTPGRNDNVRKLDSAIRKIIPNSSTSVDSSRISGPGMNTVLFLSSVPPAEQFSIVSQLKSAGIPVKRVETRIFESSRTDNLVQIAITGDSSLDGMKELTDDSLRCQLLKICEKIPVYINYDRFFDRDSINRFLKTSDAVGWTSSIATSAVTFEKPSEVRYYSTAQQAAADSVAMVASAFFRRQIRAVQVSASNNVRPASGIDLYLSPVWVKYNYENFRKLVDGPHIFDRNPNNMLFFNSNNIYLRTGSSTETWVINPNMTRYGKYYSMYMMGMQVAQNPNTYFNEKDREVFRYDKNTITPIVKETGQPELTGDVNAIRIFNFNRYDQASVYYPDTGSWQSGGTHAFRINPNGESSFVDENGDIVRLMDKDVAVDGTAGCRIYKMLTPQKVISKMMVIYDGFDGKYMALLTASASGYDLKEAFLSGWDRGPEFKKVTQTSPIPSQAKRRILWVDDSLQNIQSMKATLESESIEVSTAASNAIAEKMLAGSRYDLVISDLSRPADSTAGLTLIRAMQKLAPNTPVIICTSPASAAKTGDQARKEGARGVYTNATDLVEAVRRLFNPPKAAR